MKLKAINLETCPFCGGEGVLIHSKLDDGYIYSEGVHAFVKCKVCEACGPMPDFDEKDIPKARKQILKNKIANLRSELNYFKRRLDEENNNDEKV